MTQKEFENVLNNRLALVGSKLADKSKQYSSDVDKLHNFKKVAAFRGVSSAEALMGMVSKHIAALDDFVQACGKGGEYQNVSPEQWDEKIGDIINYMILLEALIAEQLTQK